MENKVQKVGVNFSNKLLTYFFSLILVVYYIYGFYIDENSAGAGGYTGDFEIIWGNLLLLEDDIFSNLNSLSYRDSRPPTAYILHILLNPFIYSQETFRISVFIISFLIPVLLFFSIKSSFPKLQNNLIIFLALIVTLSPYFRTSAYWGLGENYGLIFLILSYLIFQNFIKYYDSNSNLRNILSIFFMCFLSSITIYFDQKLIFVPAIIFFSIQFLNLRFKYKLLTLIFYSIFALPYVYLIFLWETVIPPSAANARSVGTLYLFNIGYLLTIISFYILHFIL